MNCATGAGTVHIGGIARESRKINRDRSVGNLESTASAACGIICKGGIRDRSSTREHIQVCAAAIVSYRIVVESAIGNRERATRTFEETPAVRSRLGTTVALDGAVQDIDGGGAVIVDTGAAVRDTGPLIAQNHTVVQGERTGTMEVNPGAIRAQATRDRDADQRQIDGPKLAGFKHTVDLICVNDCIG